MEPQNIGSKICCYVLTYDLGPMLLFVAKVTGIAFGPITHFCKITEGQKMGMFKKDANITLLSNGEIMINYRKMARGRFVYYSREEQWEQMSLLFGK